MIPVLVDGARAPAEASLPPPLQRLARRQVLELTGSRYDYDIGQLYEAVGRSLSPPQPARGARGAVKQPTFGRKMPPRFLVVTKGSLSGKEIELGDQVITVGLNVDCTQAVDDDYASSRHARLFPQDGQWFVEDLGSTNGTYLAAKR